MTWLQRGATLRSIQFVLLSIFCAGAALALPNEFAQQGYVVDQRGPLNGEHDVRTHL